MSESRDAKIEKHAAGIRRRKGIKKDFLPAWGVWLIAGIFSFIIGLILAISGFFTLLGHSLTETTHASIVSIRKAMIPAHVIAEKKAQMESNRKQVQLSMNTTFMRAKTRISVASARELAAAFAKGEILYSHDTHYLTDFQNQMDENARWIQTVSPVPPELADSRDLFVEILVSMRKMRDCFKASTSNPANVYHSMNDYQQIIFFQELKSMIDNSDRLALKLPNVPLPEPAD